MNTFHNHHHSPFTDDSRGDQFGPEFDRRGGSHRGDGPRRGGGFRGGRGPGWGDEHQHFGPGASHDPRGDFGPGFGPDGGGRRGPGRRGDERADFSHDPRGDFGPGFGPDGGGRRGPGRGRKGDVRAAIIALLGEKPMNGYQLITAIAEKSNGLWNPSAGSIYPALGLLEDEGLIVPTETDGKKLFHLTEAGTAYAEENADQVRAPWDRVAGPHKGVLGLRPEMHQLGGAIHQIAMGGDEAQIEAAREILVKARQNVYRLLAGDEAQN